MANVSVASEATGLVLQDMTIVAKRPNKNITKESNGSISLRDYNVLEIANAFREFQNVEINFDIAFAKNSSVLTASSRSVVDTLAAVMNYVGKAYQFEIRGHTNSGGSRELKTKLSESRAQTIAMLLQSNHSVANHLTATGLADTRPLTVTASSPVQSNERITIVNMGFDQRLAVKD